MKIIRLFPSSTPEAYCHTVILPDTTLLIRQRPFFVPDFTERCRTQLCLAVRITRLGRSIHEQFATRYYDTANIRIGVHFIAEDLMEKMQKDGKFPLEAMAFDDCVAITDCNSSCRPAKDGKLCLCLGNEEVELIADFDHLLGIIHREIARFSCFYTLRQGDILLYPLDHKPIYAKIDDRLSLLVDDASVLAFNIK